MFDSLSPSTPMSSMCRCKLSMCLKPCIKICPKCSNLSIMVTQVLVELVPHYTVILLIEKWVNY